MSDRTIRAQPPLEFIPPSLNPLVLRGSQTILPLWLRWKTNIAGIEADGVEILADLYHQFQEKKIRFLMAFRHPNTNDPYCMTYLLWKLLPQVARQQGISLQSPLHAHFIYDRGIPLWAGSSVGWLYSNLGSTPIVRGKVDLIGLRSARQLFAESHLPMAAAPEGATNGHNEIVSPIEPGIAQMGFWCVEDLQKAQRTEQVLIVPIGIQYRYVTPPWKEIEKLLTQLEIDTGLSVNQTSEVSNKEILYQRLYRLGERLLTLMEEFYREFYHQDLPKQTTESNPEKTLSIRLQNLLNVALQVAEQYFNLPAKGNAIDRCRRLEQAGWDRIYREELKPTHKLSPTERGLADRVAEEADLRIWHMRIVETFVAVTGYYVKEKTSAERFAETTLLLWDFVTRIKGDNPFFRPNLGKQNVKMTICEPISISQRWDNYKTNRRQAVATLTQDLQVALEKTIVSGDKDR
ncbi:MAG: 1-acyl-sn-glycerol-3-phosphate acyltransferase [Hydrococcus sp. RM1_1_31]|nr:1-acyl-sn-glycerol-3-phosphate acyltransferase [Hydrococcus sp. RM1_1_31]